MKQETEQGMENKTTSIEEIEIAMDVCERNINSAKYWLEQASNPITIRNRKNDIKIYTKKLNELKQELNTIS